MKNIVSIITLALLLANCSGSDSAKQAPQDLQGKRTLLKEKRQQLKDLEKEIAQLEEEVLEMSPETDQRDPLVTTMPVERTDFQRYVDIQGTVKAIDLVDATAEVSGRIKRLLVDEGDRVRRGQLIAELDLEQLEKQIAEIETSLELAQTVFERQSRLWEQNIGSEIQYLEAKNNKERLEKNLETVRFQLTKAKIYAPISGVVDDKLIESGELAAPGAPIVQILNTSSYKVILDLPENYLRSVRVGEEVNIIYPALGLEQTARISLIGRTIDEANRTFKVEVKVGNPQGMLKPNMLAVVEVREYAEEDVVVVPLDLIQQEVGGRRFLYVLDRDAENPRARKVYVKIGESYDGDIIVTEGLQGDETLINRGARGLADNSPVRIEENAKTADKNG